jgi:hypothetical protein
MKIGERGRIVGELRLPSGDRLLSHMLKKNDKKNPAMNNRILLVNNLTFIVEVV